MKAITCRQYGPPEVLKLEEVPKPVPREKEILIEVKATVVNSADWRLRKPDPVAVRLFLGLFKPRKKIMGGVMAGIVEQVGAGVTRFKPGDRVFGSTLMRFGAYAEYVCLPESARIALMPRRLGFNDAAAIPFGLMTALHFLRKANIRPGQEVLIIGASGAVGSAAVQLAKHFGAEVTAVCSGSNAGLVKKLGAHHLIDYTKTDFSASGKKYDVIYETISSAPYAAKIGALKPGGTLLMSDAGVGETLRSLFARGHRVVAGVCRETVEALEYATKLIEEDQLRAVIDRVYPLAQMAEAHRYVEGGHKKGNVVVQVV